MGHAHTLDVDITSPCHKLAPSLRPSKWVMSVHAIETKPLPFRSLPSGANQFSGRELHPPKPSAFHGAILRQLPTATSQHGAVEPSADVWCIKCLARTGDFVWFHIAFFLQLGTGAVFLTTTACGFTDGDPFKRFVRRIHGLVSALATCQEHDRAQVR